MGGASPASLLSVALDAARAASAVHRAHRGRTRVADWSEKGVADFVTFVDREAEAEALGAIRAAYPVDRVMAEEGSPDVPADGGRVWIVDPLDGTTNYLHGYPEYCASVAVAAGGTLLAGAVVTAESGAEFTASLGGGAMRDGDPIRVSTIERLPDYQAQFARVLRSTSGIRRAGSAALDLCHVAAGHFDGFWELSLAPWDIAAGALLVTEAGGRITRLEGGGGLLDGGGYLAGNITIHEQLGRLLHDA